ASTAGTKARAPSMVGLPAAALAWAGLAAAVFPAAPGGAAEATSGTRSAAARRDSDEIASCACRMLLRDAAGHARPAAAELRLIGVGVAAGVDHQGVALDGGRP